MRRAFVQVDVFTGEGYDGNPVAVVLESDGLTEDEMRRFARWTNLSETTFVLPPTTDDADYRLRIFTPTKELPFAGHPTLGTCHAWLATSRDPSQERIVQECEAGLVEIRRLPTGLAFAAPPVVRSGPVDDELVAHLASLLRIDHEAIVDSQWVDNGPGWVAVLLESADDVIALQPAAVDVDLGVVGPHPEGSPEAFEVRAFFPLNGATAEDPVTGSLNASLAQWLLATSRATSPYTARQGTAIGRAGRVHIVEADGEIWVGGGTVTCITGHVDL